MTPMKLQDAMWIGRLDAHDQAALVRSGEISAHELLQSAIDRIEQLDPAINAITHRAYDQALRRASRQPAGGAMNGVPYLLKDGLDYAGMPSLSGSRSRLPAVATTNSAEYTRRLDDAGLVALGKTNTPEFGLLPSTEPIVHGPARNPWNPSYSPGGSSGGAAAAVASGMVPVAHAADGGGSIRIPASCSGVFGLKPSRGANVRARGPHLIEDLLVTDALLSRSVRDAAWAFVTTSPHPPTATEYDPAAPRLRVGLSMLNFSGEQPDPEVAKVVHQSAALCAKLGHHVEEVSLPVDGPAVDACFRTIWAYLAQDLVVQCRGSLRSGRVEDVLEPWTLSLAEASYRLSPRDLEAMFEQIFAATHALAKYYSQYDILLSPVLKHPPLRLGTLSPERPFEPLLQAMFDYVSYTPLQNLTGTPAMSVPLYASQDGLPIGTMFAAARGNDARLLQLAFELEQAEPWSARWPAHSAGMLHQRCAPEQARTIGAVPSPSLQ